MLEQEEMEQELIPFTFHLTTEKVNEIIIFILEFRRHFIINY